MGNRYPAILAAALLAAPALARADASYVTSGEFLSRPFDAPRFVSALSFEDARRSLEVRLPKEA
ncbi:MAG: hypothetical protein NUW21_10800, partial [Elusimicrobia bacterium]|nr:hypothetical protein [Elusimicrobiota bacterium]